MFAFALWFLFLYLVNCTTGKSEVVPCTTVTTTLSNSVQFNCIGLDTLVRHLQTAQKNTTSINIVNSKITRIPRRGFIEFGATLETIDLQRCGIEMIDDDGFSDLYALKKLVLCENKLTRITGESFRNLYRLQHLDISFNNIAYIDPTFYQPQWLPVLETFYFDYNQMKTIDYSLISQLYSLRKVKFGKNPWLWGYRLLLTHQLENTRVDYRDDWEEWGWMSNAVKECEANGKGKVPDDSILDCVILKLLRMDVGDEHTILRLTADNITSGNICLSEATTLVDCHIRATSAGEAIRRTFEGLTTTLKDMEASSGKVPAVAVH